MVKVANYYSKDNPLPAFSAVGGYPLLYIDKSNTIYCPECGTETRDKDNTELYVSINHENCHLTCDECGERILSAYGEDDAI